MAGKEVSIDAPQAQYRVSNEECQFSQLLHDKAGDGKVSVDDAISAYRQLNTSTSRTFKAPLIALCAIGYLVTVAILFSLVIASNELTKDLSVGPQGRLMRAFGGGWFGGKADPEPVSTKEAYDELEMFDFLEMPLADLYKAESLFLTFTLAGEHIEKFYKVAEITRNVDRKLVEMHFFSGEKLVMMPQGANLYEAGPLFYKRPLAIFKGPAFDEALSDEDNFLVRDVDNDKANTDEKSDVAEDQLVPAADSTDDRALQRRSRFGTGAGSGNIYFNSGRMYDRGGIVDVGRRQRFNAVAVRGRCRGTRFQCRGY
ncbi:unnamed protein product [Vitrella brassicaformis CCMP3155]|uniref:Uncharacterized protein n=2 Tax=Vitrella brassicaformis TaxID=1169539 RepID=A0A0G4EUY1_VITBC|nr:unnamed protein product [Vitrella brassicaformis CCMP3155]|eukprot:CEM01841.1 unnamed protein product [Vitrella brassicaformis CCMP3155]